MDLAIIPECYVDTNLIETLVPPNTRYNHQKGCGTVIKTMKEHFSDRFAVGIIDKDKKVLDYLKEFDEIIIKDSLELHKHKAKPHYIIRIAPAIEKFIISNVAIAGLSLDDFDLPDDFGQLKKISKTIGSKNDVRFKKLFQTLLKFNSDEIQTLSNWIIYLKANPYTADINVLKSI